VDGFASGLIAMGYLTSALFFLKFWARTRDRLFLAFSIAFALFAVELVLVALAGVPREERGWFYLLRLSGFLMIIVGIVGKNRRST
jgi:NADH:ubiquinone oxidoreductase subunit 3 (subunit A)